MQRTSTFKLTISKVNELVFQGDVISVTFPGSEGEFTVLAQHEPIITLLQHGTITVRIAPGEEKTFIIEKGVLEASHGQVTVLV